MLNSNFINSVWSSIPYRILFLVFVFIVLLIIFLNPILNGIIKPQIINSINKNDKIDISIDLLDYNIFTNNLFGRNIIIILPSSVENKKKEKFIIRHASVKGINWLKFFTGGGLSFDNLEINNTHGFIRKNNNTADPDINKNDFLISEINSIPKRFKPLEFHNITINNFLITSFVNGKNKFTDSIKTLNLKFTGLYMDKSAVNDSLPLKYAKGLELFASGVKYHFSNDYFLKIDSLNLSTVDSLLIIKDFTYKPYVSDNEFFTHREFSSDRYIIESNLISAKGIDFKDFIWEKNIYLRNIFINAGYLNIASDISGRFDFSSFPEMPNEIFRSFNGKINVNRINIKESKIFIQSKYSYSKKYAQISFSNINAVIKNISNIESLQTIANPCKINVTAKLENKAKLSVEMNIPLLSKDISFNYKGHLDSMSVLPLNNQLEIADLTRLTSGEIKYIDFAVQVEDRLATIYVKPIYKNLKIKKLDEEKQDTGLLETIASLFANSFAIKESNPDDSGEIKIGRVIYFKKQYDTFFDLVWISLKKGIGRVVGF